MMQLLQTFNVQAADIHQEETIIMNAMDLLM